MALSFLAVLTAPRRSRAPLLPGVRSFPTTPDPASLALIPVPGAAAISSPPAKFPALSPPRLRPALPRPAFHTPRGILPGAWPSRLAAVLLFPATLRAVPPALRCSESRVLLLPIPKAASAAVMRPVPSTASTLAGRSAPATRETIATPATDPNAGTLSAALPPARLPHLRGFRTPAPFAGTPRLCVRWPALRSSYLIISLVYLAASNLPHIEPQCKSPSRCRARDRCFRRMFMLCGRQSARSRPIPRHLRQQRPHCANNRQTRERQSQPDKSRQIYPFEIDGHSQRCSN